MKVEELNKAEYDSYYQNYLNKLPKTTTIQTGFESGKIEVLNFFTNIPEAKLNYQYQPNKWTVKEILQHIIDTERIFIYRCFRIARNDTATLKGFDQNIYIKPSAASKKTKQQLLEEYAITRQFSISILNSLTHKNLMFEGNLDGNPLTARAATFIILGHEKWHIDVIKEKYL